jgi:hypothetical protein
MKVLPVYRRLAAPLLLAFATSAHAWSGAGHQTVGALTEQLLQGTPAAQRVAQLLGDVTLAQASAWLDCARGIDPAKGFDYTTRGRYAECAPFETDAGIAELRAFVQRNHRQCQPAPGAEDCHRGYHYANLAYQRSRYLPGSTGARPDDIVGAATAAIAVLQGRPAPAPFGFDSPRDALLVIAHLVGDMHQPMHIGSVYLDAQGQPVDPDKTGLDPATFTRGSNQIVIPARPPTGAAGLQAVAAGWRMPNLHSIWDGVPAALTPAGIDAAWLRATRQVPVTPGDMAGWPARWASETLDQGRPALHDLAFGPRQGEVWVVKLPPDYEARMATIKRRQLTLAAARLAQILRATLGAP